MLHALDQCLVLRPRARRRAALACWARVARRTSSRSSTCSSCRWRRLRWSSGWSGRATSPTATGTPPRTACAGRWARISYYCIPSLGPNFEYPWLYQDLDVTGVTALQDSLWNGRQEVAPPTRSQRLPAERGRVRLAARRAHPRHRPGRALHGAARLDPVGAVGVLRPHRALDAVLRLALRRRRHRRRPHRGHRVWLGGMATGQKFDRRGRSTPPEHLDVPVDDDESSRPPRGVDAAHQWDVAVMGLENGRPDLFASPDLYAGTTGLRVDS